MSRRCSGVEDTPYLDLKSAQTLARADSSMTIGNAFSHELERAGEWNRRILRTEWHSRPPSSYEHVIHGCMSLGVDPSLHVKAQHGKSSLYRVEVLSIH